MVGTPPAGTLPDPGQAIPGGVGGASALVQSGAGRATPAPARQAGRAD